MSENHSLDVSLQIGLGSPSKKLGLPSRKWPYMLGSPSRFHCSYRLRLLGYVKRHEIQMSTYSSGNVFL